MAARCFDLEFPDQHFLERNALAPCRTLRQIELPGRNDGAGDQIVVLGTRHRLRLLALREGDRQGLRQALRAFLRDRPERQILLVVDELDDAKQFAGRRIEDRRHQHLLGTIAGALVDFLQESHVRAIALQFHVIVDIVDVDGLFVCAT